MVTNAFDAVRGHHELGDESASTKGGWNTGRKAEPNAP
jgi:hypothetical protein